MKDAVTVVTYHILKPIPGESDGLGRTRSHHIGGEGVVATSRATRPALVPVANLTHDTFVTARVLCKLGEFWMKRRLERNSEEEKQNKTSRL